MVKNPKSAKKKSVSKLPHISDIKSLDGYDFIDLGSGDGASLVNNEKIIGGKGIGVEIDEEKVKKAVELERNVYLGSALDLHKLPGKVDFVTCDNFLEHLLSFEDVEEMIKQAMKVAREFIYIRHPGFEDIEYLKSLGLKTYWSDWHGHTSMVRIADFSEMFLRLGIQTVKVVPVSLIKNSNDDRILPLDAPIDQHNYEPNKHSKKPSPAKKFDRKIYYAFDIIAMMPGASENLPELRYHDRLLLTKHPRFTLKGSADPKEYRRLKRQYETLMNRKSIRIADKVGRAVHKVKNSV